MPLTVRPVTIMTEMYKKPLLIYSNKINKVMVSKHLRYHKMAVIQFQFQIQTYMVGNIFSPLFYSYFYRWLPYFLDYKTHSPPNLGGNWGASYSPNVASLAFWGEGGNSGVGFFSYFPPLKPRCVLWSSASYSPKNMVFHFANKVCNCDKTDYVCITFLMLIYMYRSIH